MSRLSTLRTQWMVTIHSGRQLVECPNCGHAVMAGQEWKLRQRHGQIVPVHTDCESLHRSLSKEDA